MIDKDGFLATQISTWIGKHRSEHARAFDLAEKASRLALRDLLAAQPADDRTAVTMMMLFGRGVATLQSAIILTERGLTADGRTLARSLVETAIHLAAAKSDPDFVDKLIAQDKNHKIKVARRLLTIAPEKSGLDSETTANLEKIDEAGKVDSGLQINLSDLATKHGMGEIYDTFYRGLSGDAAHPTIMSLNRHAALDSDGWLIGLRWGPDVDDVDDTVMAVCGAAFHLLWWAQEAFGSPDERAEFESCWAIYKLITEEKLKLQQK